MARAHHDVTSRHPLVLGIALGAVLSIAIGASSASAAAAAVEAHSNAVSELATVTEADPAAADGTADFSAPMAGATADASVAMEAAETAMSDAAALTAEVEASGLTLEVASATIDTGDLATGVAEFTDLDRIPFVELVLGTAELTGDTAEVTASAGELRAALTAAQEKKAAEEAAARAAAERAAAANTPEGAKATAREMAASQYGWGADQFSCLVSLWTKESGWNYQAYNDGSGATGIPQSLPGDKMATAGSDWRTNATTQIEWGLSYIDRAYGSPCSAWGHSQATDWY